MLVEAQGTDEAIDGPRFAAWLEKLMEDGALADAAVAQSVADTQSFWALRDACAEFFPTLGPHVSFDICARGARHGRTSPRAARRRWPQRIPGCESVYYGHIGDGNLHLVAGSAACRSSSSPSDEMDEVIYGLVREFERQRLGRARHRHRRRSRWLGHARSPRPRSR